MLSGFDPVRREIARLALHQLVADGRIHPARIEEVVARCANRLKRNHRDRKAHNHRPRHPRSASGTHPSCRKNEISFKLRSEPLAALARDSQSLCRNGIGARTEPKRARRAGLLHDIGKVPDEEPELPHAILGMKLAEKYKEKPDICNAIGAHHDEVEQQSLLAPIVQVCDAISGARPGARREVVEATSSVSTTLSSWHSLIRA